MRLNYDGKKFTPKMNSNNGEVDGRTIFNYHQSGEIIWADYAGGDIAKGYLLGFINNDDTLEFHYQHINTLGQIRIGKCRSVPHVTEAGKQELHETWQWLNGDNSVGTSVITEV